MNSELKQAAQQAIDAFDAFGDADDFVSLFELTQKMRALHAAIQQAEAQQVENSTSTGEPVAALVRQRRLRTPADCAFDKKDHYSDWSDWEPTTLSYAVAVTDPARDKGLLPLYEMLPLYTNPASSVPADVVRDAIAAVREQYRGTDWGKAAECICDAINDAMLAAKEK